MHLLLLIFAVSHLPPAPAHEAAVKAARDAAFIQSGLREDVDKVKKAAIKKVPKTLQHAAVVFSVAHKKQLRLKSREFGNWNIKRDSIEVTLSWAF